MNKYERHMAEIEEKIRMLNDLKKAYEQQCFHDFDLPVQENAKANVERLQLLLRIMQPGVVLGDKKVDDERNSEQVLVSEAKASSRKLNVFLCHSSNDKLKVRELYSRLREEKDIDPWLDEEKLLPGSNWELEISRAIKIADVVIVCLSENSINKDGYVHKEIKEVLDVADQKPEGIIFIIPLKLEKCIVPDRLTKWQWLNFYDDNGYEKLLRPLRQRAAELGLRIDNNVF